MTYTYAELARKLATIPGISHYMTYATNPNPHHIWRNDVGDLVSIIDKGNLDLSEKNINLLCVQLGISRTELDGIP